MSDCGERMQFANRGIGVVEVEVSKGRATGATGEARTRERKGHAESVMSVEHLFHLKNMTLTNTSLCLQQQ